MIRLDESLDALAESDPQRAKIVELNFFAGLTNEEIAKVVGTSDSTVKREWRIAKSVAARPAKKRLNTVLCYCYLGNLPRAISVTNFLPEKTTPKFFWYYRHYQK